MAEAAAIAVVVVLVGLVVVVAADDAGALVLDDACQFLFDVPCCLRMCAHTCHSTQQQQHQQQQQHHHPRRRRCHNHYHRAHGQQHPNQRSIRSFKITTEVSNNITTVTAIVPGDTLNTKHRLQQQRQQED